MERRKWIKIGELRKYMKERKYILLLFSGYYFWTTISIRSSFEVSHCYSWCHHMVCRLYFFFGTIWGKMIVFLTQFIFIWTTLFSLLFFQGFSLKKVVRNFSYPLDKLKIRGYLFPQTHPRVKQISVHDWPKQHRRECGRGNRKEEVLAQEDFAY